jgi:hypothetical protein
MTAGASSAGVSAKEPSRPEASVGCALQPVWVGYGAKSEHHTSETPISEAVVVMLTVVFGSDAPVRGGSIIGVARSTISRRVACLKGLDAGVFLGSGQARVWVGPKVCSRVVGKVELGIVFEVSRH